MTYISIPLAVHVSTYCPLEQLDGEHGLGACLAFLGVGYDVKE